VTSLAGTTRTRTTLRHRLVRLAERATTPLLPADYLDLFDPLRPGADLRGRIVAVQPETTDAATIVIRPGADWAGHVPGQYVRIGVDVNGIRQWRAYSLTHGPRRDGRISVTVKAVPDGLVSTHLVRRARVGTLIHLEQAAGDFVLPTEGGRFLFVTAGSGITPVIGRTMEEAQEKYDQLQALLPDDVALAALARFTRGVDIFSYPLDGPMPELPEANSAKSRQKLIMDMAKKNNMTLRQVARSVSAAQGHRVLVGTPEYIADELQEWLEKDAADGFNVICNYYPKPFEDFSTLVIPELQRRGIFRTAYEGKTLRENLGLKVPENRYTAARQAQAAD